MQPMKLAGWRVFVLTLVLVALFGGLAARAVYLQGFNTGFLQQKGKLSPGRVTTPDGMGVAADAGSGSNADARKVVAKLVIDKGVHDK